MNISVSTLTSNALRLCGQMELPGRGFSPEQQVEVLQFLNQMLDGWNTLRNQMWSIEDEVFDLVTNQADYTIGPGGDFDTNRPQFIQDANLIIQTGNSDNVRYPLKCINVDYFAAIRVRPLGAQPIELYYQTSYSQTPVRGLGLIRLYPFPNQVYQLELFLPSQLNSDLGIGDTLYVPPGYADSISWNLAVAISPLYPHPNKGTWGKVEARAYELKRIVENRNSPQPIASIDPALGGRKDQLNSWNWLNGNY